MQTSVKATEPFTGWSVAGLTTDSHSTDTRTFNISRNNTNLSDFVVTDTNIYLTFVRFSLGYRSDTVLDP